MIYFLEVKTIVHVLKMFPWQFSYSWTLATRVDLDNLYTQMKTKHEEVI